MNAAVDQFDETEVEILSNAEVEAAYRNHRDAVGADPLAECDPSPEQITAMFAKVIKRNEAPYADFSVMTPYGRSQKQSKARNFLLQMDGTWKTVEIPGPPTYAAWVACWKVYKIVLLMLKHPGNTANGVPDKRVTTVAALEEYANRIAELNDEFSEAWHLLLQAEDRCRGEQFERFRRELVRAKLDGRLPMNLDYDDGQPWMGVFSYAARAQDYWDRHVVRPAQTFIARGGGGKSITKKEANDVHFPDAASHGVQRPQAKINPRRRGRGRMTVRRFKHSKPEMLVSQMLHGTHVADQQPAEPVVDPVEREAEIIQGSQAVSFKLTETAIRFASALQKGHWEHVRSRAKIRGLTAANTALELTRTLSAPRIPKAKSLRERANDMMMKQTQL